MTAPADSQFPKVLGLPVGSADGARKPANAPQRPSPCRSSARFPLQGLRVLLVDEHPSRSVVEAQLRQPELQYAGTPQGAGFMLGGGSAGRAGPPLSLLTFPSSLRPAVTAVSTAAEALGFLRAGVAAFDVVLAEVGFRGLGCRRGAPGVRGREIAAAMALAYLLRAEAPIAGWRRRAR